LRKPYARHTRAYACSLQGMEGVRRYFAWAGFRAPDLILHVIETDEELRGIVRAFLVDFSDLSLPVGRPERPHRYEQLQVPSELFRHVLGCGLSWAELQVGARSRLYRTPGVPTLDFWSHFQHRLPAVPLPWNAPANDVEPEAVLRSGTVV
jgi:hypothetical protein